MQIDSDLVFEDPVQRANSLEHRHRRDSSKEHEHADGHWLSRTVHRIKRGFYDWFGSDKETHKEKPVTLKRHRIVRNTKEEEDGSKKVSQKSFILK